MFYSIRRRILEFGQFASQTEVGFGIRTRLAAFAVTFFYIIDHVGERSAGEENFVDAFALHSPGVIVRDRAAAAAKYRHVVRTLLLQLANDISKKIDVTAVVTGNPDRSHILLNGRTHDVADVTMKSKVYHFDSVADEFKVNGVNRTVVTVADR